MKKFGLLSRCIIDEPEPKVPSWGLNRFFTHIFCSRAIKFVILQTLCSGTCACALAYMHVPLETYVQVNR